MATEGIKPTPRRPVTEEITVEKALELLRENPDGNRIVTIVRDPNNLDNIISISLNEAV